MFVFILIDVRSLSYDLCIDFVRGRGGYPIYILFYLNYAYYSFCRDNSIRVVHVRKRNSWCIRTAQAVGAYYVSDVVVRGSNRCGGVSDDIPILCALGGEVMEVAEVAKLRSNILLLSPISILDTNI